jgi:hypothetical protein
LDGSGSGLLELLCCQERLRETTKNSALVANNPSEIHTEHLPNKILDHFRYTSLLLLSLLFVFVGFTTEATFSSNNANNDHVIKIIQCSYYPRVGVQLITSQRL